MRPKNRAQHVVSRANVCHPIAHGFVDGIFQCLAAGGYRNHPCAQQFHSKYIQFLAANVFFTHIDIAFQAQKRANRRCSYAMLARSCFRDDSFLGHPAREQALSKAVIDLVRTRVIEILALQVNPGAAPGLRQPCSVIQRGRASRVGVEQLIELRMEAGIALRLTVRDFELLQGMHECFGYELPTVISVMTFHSAPITATSVRWTASMNRRILS